MLDAATHPHADREVALVAVDGDADGAGQRIVGGGRFAWTPGKDIGEFAVTIADDWQGIGLARHIMETLISLARARGLRRLEGYVLPDNTGMRGLAGRLGFADTVCPDDRTLRLVSIDFDQPAM
jgi:RimJ/RimL family protein N-acetyltransferase